MRASRERLMLAPSRSRSPFAWVLDARSEPARSIKLILATRRAWVRPGTRSCCFTKIWGQRARVRGCRASGAPSWGSDPPALSPGRWHGSGRKWHWRQWGAACGFGSLWSASPAAAQLKLATEEMGRRGLWSPLRALLPNGKAALQNPCHPLAVGSEASIHRLPGEGTLEKQWGCWCHPSPIPNLVEGKSLHHNPLVGVLTDGEWPLGLQEVVDLLIVHLRRREARSRLEEQGQSRSLFPRVWEG